MKIEQVMNRYGYSSSFDTNDLVSALNQSQANGDKEAVKVILGFTGGLIPIWQHLHQ